MALGLVPFRKTTNNYFSIGINQIIDKNLFLKNNPGGDTKTKVSTNN